VKGVWFGGGLGRRLRGHSDTIPKPLVTIGLRPVLWHLMRYYAHFGHSEFILCLGYRGDLIREYFLNYNEAMSNDFVLSDGGRRVELLKRDLDGWRITFVDTGLHSNIGQRLLRVRQHLEGEPAFLANYADGLADLPLDRMIDDFRRRSVVASVTTVRSPLSFHTLSVGGDGIVTSLATTGAGVARINGGFFVLRHDIFDYVREGEDLIGPPFERLIGQRALAAWPHEGFWQAMDTFKDKITFDRMEAQGTCPWMVWRK